MKKLLLLLSISFLAASVFAQGGEEFTRKGKILVETGSSFFSGSGSSTGGSILFNEGSTVTQVGLEIGKFISEDFAIKGKVGIFGSDGITFTNFSAGAKYYIGGVAPIDIDLGIVSGFGSTTFIGAAHLGYAIKAASNIYFEPKAGIIYSEESTVGSVKFSFALMF